MKKFLIFLIIFVFPIKIFAIENWTQTTIGENFGIWSTIKRNLTETPSFIFRKDGVLGVAVSNLNNFLNTNFFKSGDIVAKRYCFEESKECATSFKQNFTNNNPFTLKTGIPNTFQDPNFTIPYTDSSKPMYIKLTPELLNQMEFETPQTTKWMTIAETLWVSPHKISPRQLWISASDNFNTLSDTFENKKPWDSDLFFKYPANHPTIWLRWCYYTDLVAWRKNILSYNFNFCSRTGNQPWVNEITRVDMCAKGDDWYCWRIAVEYRLVPSYVLGWHGREFGEICANEVKYWEILNTLSTLSKEDSKLSSTPFFDFQVDESKNVNCYRAHLGSAIQMRYVVTSHIGNVSALSSIVQPNRRELWNKINSIGVMFLND